MKLVQEAYRDERKFIVSEDLIERGFDCEDNNDILTDAGEGVFKQYLKDNEDELLSNHYNDYLEEHKINYQFLPEKYISIEDMKELTSKWKYWYDDANCEYTESKELLDIQECNYLEYWNGNDWEQIELRDDIIDLEKIQSDLQENELNGAKFGQYDLYKDKEDNLYLNWQSYYIGQLSEVEEITEDELKERFNYTLA